MVLVATMILAGLAGDALGAAAGAGALIPDFA